MLVPLVIDYFSKKYKINKMHLRMLGIMMCFEVKWVSSDSSLMKKYTKSFLVTSLEYRIPQVF